MKKAVHDLRQSVVFWTTISGTSLGVFVLLRLSRLL